MATKTPKAPKAAKTPKVVSEAPEAEAKAAAEAEVTYSPEEKAAVNEVIKEMIDEFKPEPVTLPHTHSDLMDISRAAKEAIRQGADAAETLAPVYAAHQAYLTAAAKLGDPEGKAAFIREHLKVLKQTYKV